MADSEVYPNLLALEDMNGLSQDEIKAHILKEWEPKDPEQLQRCNLLIAYESVGSWGCDSSGFYLFQDNDKLFEANGSHCSCYGFEQQWNPEETTIEALLMRKFNYSLGGYDNSPKENEQALEAYVKSMEVAK